MVSSDRNMQLWICQVCVLQLPPICKVVLRVHLLDSSHSGRGPTPSQPLVLHAVLCVRGGETDHAGCLVGLDGIDMNPKLSGEHMHAQVNQIPPRCLQKTGMGHTPSNRHWGTPPSLHSQPPWIDIILPSSACQRH